MKFLICSAAALAIASPAVAQKSGTTAKSPDKSMSMPGDSAATPATPADPSTDTSATPAMPATPSAQANDPATILKTEFPVYDKDANGDLNKDEFSTWLLALKKAAPQQTMLTDQQQTEWLGKAFTDADADKSTSISLAELTSYLTRGAKG
jgi:hypothetical protein